LWFLRNAGPEPDRILAGLQLKSFRDFCFESEMLNLARQ
jgi:hypothetical protein